MGSLVSVVILTWNRKALLKQAIDSVLNQTYQDFEILIIDNESTDGTSEFVIGLNDKRVRYFSNPNGGILSVNRNFGIRQSVGDYIAFCDDDDLWLPNKLERQMEFLKLNPDYKVVCANGIYFDEKGDIGRLIKKSADAELTIDDFLKVKNSVVLTSVLINKEIFGKVGLYNEDPRITTVEDYEFMTRVAAAGFRIYYLNDVLVKYRMHDVMTSHSNSLVAISKIGLFFKELYEKKILNRPQFRTAQINLAKRYLFAYIKELFKKSVLIKNTVYRLRRTRLKTRTERSE